MFNLIMPAIAVYLHIMTKTPHEQRSWRERVGLPVSPTNERIPHADTERRIRRRDAIGAEHNPGDSATQTDRAELQRNHMLKWSVF